MHKFREHSLSRRTSSTTVLGEVLEHPSTSNAGTEISHSVAISSPLPDTDFKYTNEELISLPPSMAYCYNLWEKTETRIRWCLVIDGVAVFLEDFSTPVSIPYHAHDQPSPYYACFGDIDQVLALAMDEGIDIHCHQLYNDLLVWAESRNDKIQGYAPDLREILSNSGP